MNHTLAALLALGLVHTATTVHAAETKPTDPSASAPALSYRSAFEGYTPFREQPIANWRALNAEVGAVGGHVGIMGGAGGHGAHSPGMMKPGAAKPGAADAPRATPQAPGAGAHAH